MVAHKDFIVFLVSEVFLTRTEDESSEDRIPLEVAADLKIAKGIAETYLRDTELDEIPNESKKDLSALGWRWGEPEGGRGIWFLQKDDDETLFIEVRSMKLVTR